MINTYFRKIGRHAEKKRDTGINMKKQQKYMKRQPKDMKKKQKLGDVFKKHEEESKKYEGIKNMKKLQENVKK